MPGLTDKAPIAETIPDGKRLWAEDITGLNKGAMSDTKNGLINAVAQQRDYVVRLGQYCLDQQQR